jgi:hypothetical protein
METSELHYLYTYINDNEEVEQEKQHEILHL